eukprot:TRINITY_DN1385_c0_g1_i1.p1 TRINITY_DN1385_c0_g1~~TRINITY_DN1385_c0_g1_i1.p1  ORF type:complete len:152 (-),score=32.73 TRINITY_DN1385_c0_g1_i1:137-592(-)
MQSDIRTLVIAVERLQADAATKESIQTLHDAATRLESMHLDYCTKSDVLERLERLETLQRTYVQDAKKCSALLESMQRDLQSALKDCATVADIKRLEEIQINVAPKERSSKEFVRLQTYLAYAFVALLAEHFIPQDKVFRFFASVVSAVGR